MKLEKVHVTNFRSVDDSEEFGVEPVTCLVGKNEAGKSAILLALAALNPHPSTPAAFDRERDYPRRLLTQYDDRHGGDAAVAITTSWRLTPAELTSIAAAVGEDVVTADVVTISRAYGKDIDVSIGIDFGKALEHLYVKFELDDSERSVLTTAGTTSTLITALGKLSSPTERHTALKAHLDAVGTVTGRVSKLICGMMPKFMYFAAYDRMDGAIQLELTRQLIANGQINQDAHRGARLFAEFLEYARVSIDDITKVDTYETFNARLQAASNDITD
ncbi:AAA family ATPase [Paracoccus simplex]|uniref:AAA family ATPase n=1 Tax=Paracoccus simplex TaxID=2086346 RepID=A0ABV7S5A1_9RHOB